MPMSKESNMSLRKRSRLALLLLLPFTIPAQANDTDLTVAKVHESFLSPGKSQSFSVSLSAGDFAQIALDPSAKELILLAFAPSGTKCRGARLGPGPARFTFIADRSGSYRIEVSATAKSVKGPFTITLEKVLSLSVRLAFTKPIFESPRIKALRSSIESGREGSLDAFWQEIQNRGSPIIEPLPGDTKNMLVTFLWRDTPNTHNVMILRLPYAAATPDDYLMNRLSDTDVWYATVLVDRKVRFEYTVAPNVPRLEGIAYGLDMDIITMIATAARPDPLNPNRWHVDKLSVDAPEFLGNSFVEMPDAPPQPWLAEKPGVLAGQIEKHQFKSNLLQNDREIAVYLPPGYSKSANPYPLLVLFDEQAYLGDQNHPAFVPTPTILNNLIAEKRIPPMVALLIGNAPNDARSRELPCNPVFADFLASELLPWAHSQFNFTTDPSQTVVAGSSYGGLASAYAGLRHPETFGNILSQSGSFHWTPPNSNNSSGAESASEPNWLARQFIASPKLPLRFYLEAGSDEIDFTGSSNAILPATRNLRDVLQAKGYEVQFHEFAGGHDYLTWRGTLADALIFLMGTAPSKPAPNPPTQPN